MSNNALNTFFQGLLDKDGSFSDEDDYIDDLGAVDDEKLDRKMAREEAADERKRNILLSLMHIAELEEQEQREFDAVDLKRHREEFRGRRKKRRKATRQRYCDPITGRMRRVCPQLSNWWLDYIENPEPSCHSWNNFGMGEWQRL
jgi:hypothetical protein